MSTDAHPEDFYQKRKQVRQEQSIELRAHMLVKKWTLENKLKNSDNVIQTPKGPRRIASGEVHQVLDILDSIKGELPKIDLNG